MQFAYKAPAAKVEGGANALEPVWRNGELLRDETLAAVRARVAASDEPARHSQSAL
jgi:hypothetical protein